MKHETRILNIESRLLDTEQRTVPAVISSEYPVPRGDFNEVLSHAPSAVDLSRAPLPLIESHDTQRLNIGLVEALRLDGPKLRGTLRLGRSERANEVLRDIQDGVVRNLSVGYIIHDYQQQGDTVLVTRWEPYETSLVSTPADPTAGINRNLPMTEQTTETPAETPEQQNQAERAMAAERERVTEIRQLFNMPAIPRTPKFEALQTRAITEGYAPDRVRNTILQALSEDSAPIRDYSQPSLADMDAMRWRNGPRADVVQSDDLTQAAVDALAARAGFRVPSPHPAARDLSQMSFRDMVRTIESRQDRPVRRGWFSRGSGATTSDFVSLLADVARKVTTLALSEAEHNWRPWTRHIEVDDFKAVSLAGLGSFSDLELVPESGEYRQGTLIDYDESVQVATYGKNFGLTREALYNDDLGEFAALSRRFAASASRTVAKLAFGRLTSNPTLKYDAKAVFHADHSNLASSGFPVSQTTLDAGIQAMRLQTAHMRDTDDSDPVYLNISPKYLLVPVSAELSAKTVVASAWYPIPDVGDVPSPFAANPLQNALTVISDPLLDASSAPKAWYLVADPMQFDGVVVATLRGSGDFGLSVETFMPDHNSDTTWFKVRIDVGAAAVDFRTLYKDPGE